MIAARSPRSVDRRHPSRFARLLLGSVLVALLLVVAVGLAGYVWPAVDSPADLHGTRVVGTVDEFAPASVTSLRPQGIRAYLVRFEDGSFRAFFAVDPVYGCSLAWIAREAKFFDPCHGNGYDVHGRALPENGIPVELGQFQVDVSNSGNVRVDLGSFWPARSGRP